MKRMLPGVLAIAITFSLTACNFTKLTKNETEESLGRSAPPDQFRGAVVKEGVTTRTVEASPLDFKQSEVLELQSEREATMNASPIKPSSVSSVSTGTPSEEQQELTQKRVNEFFAAILGQVSKSQEELNYFANQILSGKTEKEVAEQIAGSVRAKDLRNLLYVKCTGSGISETDESRLQIDLATGEKTFRGHEQSLCSRS